VRGIAYLQHSHQPAISYRHRQTKAIEDSCHILVSFYPGLKRQNGVVGRIYRVTLSNYCTHLANLRLRCLQIYGSKTLTSTNRNDYWRSFFIALGQSTNGVNYDAFSISNVNRVTNCSYSHVPGCEIIRSVNSEDPTMLVTPLSKIRGNRQTQIRYSGWGSKAGEEVF